MIVVRKLKEGEPSTMEQIQERVRIYCGWSKEDFYGWSGRGSDLFQGFMTGLWIGCKDK